MFQNAVHTTAEKSHSAAAGQLAFESCRACGFIWNSAFDADKIQYAEGYDNSQIYSDAFQIHLASRIKRVLAALPPDGDVTIVEIGCGQGDFLNQLMAALPKDRRICAVGFDPAYRKRPTPPEGIEIHAEYFTAESAKRLAVAPDIVVSRHTIEHVPDPVAFLRAIRSTLASDRPARLVLETPDNSWILRHEAFYDFFYEHCSLFDFRSITTVLNRAGFHPSMIETCFQGQYLWVEATPAAESSAIKEFASRADEFVVKWRETLTLVRLEGPIALWGAGAKGATFALMMDPEFEDH